MAHTDLHLLRAILVSKDIVTPLKLGVTKETMLTPDGKIGFDLILNNYNRPENNSQVMTMEAFRCECPSVCKRLPDDNMTIVEASKISIEAARQHVWLESLNKAAKLEDVDEAMSVMQAGIDRVRLFNTKDKVHDFGYEAYAHVIQEYDTIKRGHGMMGYPWPSDWNILNDKTSGIEKGMYILIHGRPGNMKSYILCKLAVHFLENTDLRVYFFNNEMTTEKLLTRLALIHARINSRRYRKGLLDASEEIRLHQTLAQLHEMTRSGKIESRIAISDPDWSRTVAEMGARLKEHKSHICLLDGGYLMMTAKGNSAEKPEHATRVSREIQRQSLITQIPHIVSTQTGRVAETQSIAQRIQTVSNIGYADAWGQDAAFVISVMLGRTELTMLFPKVREDEKVDPFTINAHPGEDFSYKGEYISKELYELEKKNTSGPRQHTADESEASRIDCTHLRSSIFGEVS